MYTIYAKYLNTAPEAIDEAETEEEALTLMAGYAVAFGPGWEIDYVKE